MSSHFGVFWHYLNVNTYSVWDSMENHGALNSILLQSPATAKINLVVETPNILLPPRKMPKVLLRATLVTYPFNKYIQVTFLMFI